MPLTAKRQSTMNTGDISCKLIDSSAALGSLGRMVHRVGNRANLLPFVIGESSGMQTAMPLLFVLHDASIIVRGIGRIKFIAQNGSDSIAGKKPFTKPLAPCPIACLIDFIGYFISRKPLHT